MTNEIIETAAEANFNSHQDVALELHDVPKVTLAEVPDWVREQWLLNTKAALASLAQHRDDIARELYEAIPDVDRTWEHLDEWSVNIYRKQADAVLAYLAGEES